MIRRLRKGRKAVIPYINNNRDSYEDLYTIEDIFGLLNLIWYHDYYPAITLLKCSMNHLMDSTGIYTTITGDSIKDIFSSIYHIDFSEVIRPPFESNDEAINSKLKLLENKSAGCSFYIPNSEPVEQVILDKRILKHGICSNGCFLFTLNEDKVISRYLLYYGKILLNSRQDFIVKWNGFNDKTKIYCSQSRIFLVAENKDQIYINISETIKNMEDCQAYLDGNLSNDKKEYDICSNGITYTTIINSTANFYDCNSENKIFSENIPAISFDHFLTNGSAISFYNSNSFLEITMLLSGIYDKNYKFSKKKSETEYDIISYDCLCECFYAGEYIDCKTRINIIPYHGPPDLKIFNIPITAQKENTKFYHKLRIELASLLFSSNVPDTLIFFIDAEKNFKILMNYLILFRKNVDVLISLLVILDINLHHCEKTYYISDILNYLIILFDDERYKKLSLGIIIHNAYQLLKPITEAKTKILFDLLNLINY